MLASVFDGSRPRRSHVLQCIFVRALALFRQAGIALFLNHRRAIRHSLLQKLHNGRLSWIILPREVLLGLNRRPNSRTLDGTDLEAIVARHVKKILSER